MSSAITPDAELAAEMLTALQRLLSYQLSAHLTAQRSNAGFSEAVVAARAVVAKAEGRV